MGLQNALNYKPIKVLGFITAFHSVIYGAGYLTGRGGFDGALLGLSINSVATTTILGTLLLLVGGTACFAFVRANPKTIRLFSKLQSILWLFITFMYLFNGAYLLALGIGLTWTVLSYYIALASQNRTSVIAYDQTDVAKRDTENEDQL